MSARDFEFLEEIGTHLIRLVDEALRDENTNPRAAVLNIGLVTEGVARWLGEQASLAGRERAETAAKYIERLREAGVIPSVIGKDFHRIRKLRNLLLHEIEVLPGASGEAIDSLAAIGRWFTNRSKASVRSGASSVQPATLGLAGPSNHLSVSLKARTGRSADTVQLSFARGRGKASQERS